MRRRRFRLGLLLLTALLATLGTVTFGLPDAAFTPSYFDAQDGDGALLWVVLGGLPALLLAVSAAVAAPRARAAASLLAVCARSLASPRAARLCAAPLA